MSSRPLLLILFVTVLIADLAYLVMRSRMRRRAALSPQPNPVAVDPAPVDTAVDDEQLVAAAQ